MTPSTRKQLIVLGIFVLVFALLGFITYAVIPPAQLAPPGQGLPAPTSTVPRWQVATTAAAGIFVIYGLLGLAGYRLARRLDLPAIFREAAGWRAWLVEPLLIGLGVGMVLVLADQILASLGAAKAFLHPAFPLSLIASATAGIGEEILFRGFMLGVWASVLGLVLQGSNGRRVALWVGNVIAALAFSAAHLPAAMLLLNVTSAAAIPAWTLVEIFVLNSFMGLIAGQRYMRDGLVAAIGVHFWADVVWHVIWPLLGLSA